tara:strand:- start:5218 stop:6459 length:1242 start_codon:yes stop_codon:yes gene_type:complete
MMTDFLTLNDVCEFIVDTKHKTPKFVDAGYPCIRTPNIGKGFLILGNVKHVSEESYLEWTERAKPSEGDLIFAREAPVGNVIIIPKGLKVCHGQRTVLIRADKSKVYPHYLMYLMLGEELQGLIHSMASGATVAHLNMSDIRTLKLSKLPPIPAQKEIATYLVNYDNLTENNNRRIAILEDMAQSLYREWFVNFRYPGYADAVDKDGNQKLINSPLGQIPEGWVVKSAAEAININPSTKLTKDGEKPFVGMSGLSEGSMVIGDIIEKTGNSGTKFINRDTLFARITPCLQNGKTGFVQFLTPEQPIGFGSTEFIVLRESEYLSSEFIYLLSRSNNFREHAIQSMTGATGRQRVHNDCFASCYLPVPPKELMNEFTAMVQPMFKSIFNLSKRNENLKQQRDMLLPKLISGQIEL